MYAVYAAGDIHYANIIRYVVKEKLPRCAFMFTNRPSLRPLVCDRVPPAGNHARFSPAYSCESTDESSPWYGYVSEPRGGDTIALRAGSLKECQRECASSPDDGELLT